MLAVGAFHQGGSLPNKAFGSFLTLTLLISSGRAVPLRFLLGVSSSSSDEDDEDDELLDDYDDEDWLLWRLLFY